MLTYESGRNEIVGAERGQQASHQLVVLTHCSRYYARRRGVRLRGDVLRERERQNRENRQELMVGGRNKTMNSIAVIRGLGLCLTVAVCSAAQSPATDWSSVVSRTKAAVVVIETDRGLGSGFLVRPNGILVTNRHVISGATQIAVTFSTG